MFLKAKKIIFLFIIVLSTIFFASPAFASCPTGKTAVIGNSLGVGIGNALKAKCPNSDITVLAKSGWQTQAIKQKQLESQVINGNEKYNNVIIIGGYNDIHNGKNKQQVLLELRNIYRIAQENNIGITAMTIPPLGNNHQNVVKEVNSQIKTEISNTVDTANMWATSGNVHDGSSYNKVADHIITSVAFPEAGAPITPPPSTMPTPPMPKSEVEPSTTLLTGSTACEMWQSAFTLGISFVGVAALLAIVWGGFSYMTAYGNQEKTKNAKATIWGAITGMLIALFAYSIFSLINPYLLECKIESPFQIQVHTTPGRGPSGPTTGPYGSGPQTDIGKCTKTYNPNNRSSRYGQQIKDAAEKYGIDPFFLESTLEHESEFNNSAKGSSGERSMAQFMPSTFKSAAKQWGGSVDPTCLRENTIKPFNSSTANGYCYKKHDSVCPMTSHYAQACINWIEGHPNEIVWIAATHIASLKRSVGDNYACIAVGYNGGAGTGKAYCSGRSIEPGPLGYLNGNPPRKPGAVGFYNKACQRGQ